MRTFANLEVDKILAIIALVMVTIVLFLVLNWLHFRFLPVQVVMYDAFIDVAAALIAASAIAWSLSRGLHALNGHEIALSLTVGALCCALYAVVVPTVIDRSLSVYLLEKLEQRGGGIRQTAFPAVFTDEYLPEHRLTDIRLTEQLHSGTIRIVDGCVTLTDRGRIVIAFTKFYRHNFLPRHRDIMGVYSDHLTDPLRHSVLDVSYRCAPSSS